MMRQPYHLVEMSPWPLTTGISTLLLTSSTCFWLHHNNKMFLGISLILMSLSITQWWRDTFRESTYMGFHNWNVMEGLKIGMILFITSEICFFMAFFWTYFNSSLSPNFELGILWPPMGISVINPISVPLLNTIVLLSSGITVSIAHHYMLALLNYLY